MDTKRQPTAPSTLALALFGVIGLTACAPSTPPPALAMMKAKVEVDRAEASGAEEDPVAAAHLEAATAGLVRAQALVADGEQEEAELVLERAFTDALVAREYALLADSRARARDAYLRLSRLRHEAAEEIVKKRGEDDESTPTAALVVARRSYAAAARRTMPHAGVELAEAKAALNRAEHAHDEAPGSPLEKERAYVAQKLSELAIVAAERRRAGAAAIRTERRCEVERSRIERYADVSDVVCSADTGI